MATPFEAVAIADKVYWVGAVDWTIRNFHGYETGRGTTYNAYLVLADKVTLVDT
ncbi:MAG TPA: FprA family A-type flavoprotein, partial [Phycisphaerae bacterium]|nr:FprA family A-type flavoprotein [Phycisphaerae bacterium]